MGLTPIAPTPDVVFAADAGQRRAGRVPDPGRRLGDRSAWCSPAGAAGPPRGCISASSPCSAWSPPRRRSCSRSSPASRSTAASTTGSRPAPARSSTTRCRSPRPMPSSRRSSLRIDILGVKGELERAPVAPRRGPRPLPGLPRRRSPRERSLPGVFLVNGDGSLVAAGDCRVAERFPAAAARRRSTQAKAEPDQPSLIAPGGDATSSAASPSSPAIDDVFLYVARGRSTRRSSATWR